MKKSILAVLVVGCMRLNHFHGHQRPGCSQGTTDYDGMPLRAGDAPDSYMLSDLEKGPKSVGIVSSSANLKPHVGHKIEITGTAVAPADAEAMKGVPKSPHYMKVTAVKMLSPTCP